MGTSSSPCDNLSTPDANRCAHLRSSSCWSSSPSSLSWRRCCRPPWPKRFYIVYPLISVAPGSAVLEGSSARILAPLSLIAVDLTIKRGAVQSVAFAAKSSGVDLVVANFPLLAWLEQQTGHD